MLVHETCNGFIVLDQEKYKGVLTKNDIIQGLAKLGKGAKAENAANTDVKPVQMNESLEKVYQRMRQSGLDILPVFSNDELKGIVDIENIKEFIIVKNALD
jgi:predicted transcriptional regulator